MQTMVVREQPSGKLLMGIFLVDTYCLGIKSASYHVNLEEEKVTEMLEIMGENEESPLISCDYVLLHNLIYGALAYAEEIGFFPDPDFGVARYMLEEDTDEIELMDLEFGKDGQPFFVAGPYDNVNRILVTLERKVGKGNFSYLLNIGGI